jgi:hypothetical protein
MSNARIEARNPKGAMVARQRRRRLRPRPSPSASQGASDRRARVFPRRSIPPRHRDTVPGSPPERLKPSATAEIVLFGHRSASIFANETGMRWRPPPGPNKILALFGANPVFPIVNTTTLPGNVQMRRSGSPRASPRFEFAPMPLPSSAARPAVADHCLKRLQWPTRHRWLEPIRASTGHTKRDLQSNGSSAMGRS